jgi:hypothetical protein
MARICQLEKTVKRPLLITYLLIVSTAVLLLWLWLPLMVVGGSVGYDWWKSLLITGLYLWLLKKVLPKKSSKALVCIALGAILMGPLSQFIMQGDGNNMRAFNLSAWVSILMGVVMVFLPGILVVSGLYLLILVKFMYRHKPKKGLYYQAAAFLGVGLAILYFFLMLSEMTALMLMSPKGVD